MVKYLQRKVLNLNLFVSDAPIRMGKIGFIFISLNLLYWLCCTGWHFFRFSSFSTLLNSLYHNALLCTLFFLPSRSGFTQDGGDISERLCASDPRSPLPSTQDTYLHLLSWNKINNNKIKVNYFRAPAVRLLGSALCILKTIQYYSAPSGGNVWF